MPSILDKIIGQGEEDRPFMGFDTSDVLKKGPKKGTVQAVAFNPEASKVTITTKVGSEGLIFENYRLDKGGLNYLLGVAQSAGIKTVGRKLKDIMKELKGKGWYFDYTPPAEGEKYHKIGALMKADYDRKMAARAQADATGDGDAGWDDDEPAPEPERPAQRTRPAGGKGKPEPEPEIEEEEEAPAEEPAAAEEEYDFL